MAAPGPSEDPESAPAAAVLEDEGCASPPAPKLPSPVSVAEAVPKEPKVVDADLRLDVVVVVALEREPEENEPPLLLLANTDTEEEEELLKLSTENGCIEEAVLLGKSEEVGTAIFVDTRVR